MIAKRVAAVITVRKGIAVQSFGYARYLPMGDAAVVAQNFDRWGADEIIVNCIDRQSLGPDFDLISRLNRMGLATPLIYGGGIRSAEEGVRAIQLGADRVFVDSLLRDDPDAVVALSMVLGSQGVIAALPLSMEEGCMLWRDYRQRLDTPLSPQLLENLAKRRCAEAMVIDWQSEGQPGKFNDLLVKHFPLNDMPLIAFGGLGTTDQTRSLMARENIVAVAVGNMLAYQEHAVQKLKSGLMGLPVRAPFYASCRGGK